MKTLISKITTLLIVFGILSNSKAQQCGFDQINQYLKDIDSISYKQRHQANINWWNYWRSVNPGNYDFKPQNMVGNRSSCIKARIIIPVAVHVIHNGGIENISFSQAQHAIEVLNEHFANVLGTNDPLSVNTGIQFVLVRFNQIQNNLTVHKKSVETGQLMGLKMNNVDTFINIWVVKQILDANGNDIGVNGYATYPGNVFAGGKQGVVVRYDWFGKSSFNSNMHYRSAGDVTSHEVGHYLGLYHPFEGGCVGLTDSTAYIEGDLCRDVPAINQADTNCIGFHNSCVETYSLLSWGINPPDQKQLFMDYSSPECKTSFTNDQTKLMYARLQQYHPTLGSPLFMPKGYPNFCVSSARIDGITGACKGDSIKLSTYNLNNVGGSNVSYLWKLYKKNTLITSYSSGPNFSYSPDTGIYSLYLQVTNNGYTTYDTLLNQIEIFDCSKKLPSTKGNWYMGKYAGLNFAPDKSIMDVGPWSNRTPTQLNVPEGSMCMSDSLGNLLFYGGPCPDNLYDINKNVNIRVFGKNYREIDGSPLIGDGTSGQGPLAVPIADSAGKYMIFYSPFPNPPDGQYLKYSQIDVNKVKINGFNDTSFGKIVRRQTKVNFSLVSVYRNSNLSFLC